MEQIVLKEKKKKYRAMLHILYTGSHEYAKTVQKLQSHDSRRFN